mmetsp:Transcript_18230/g.15898  ORF Transcript_18230/g.15898 Transcript_18230/m.15898 type:complete len:126 (-) Transcript_18230:700-1077(-)
MLFRYLDAASQASNIELAVQFPKIEERSEESSAKEDRDKMVLDIFEETIQNYDKKEKKTFKLALGAEDITEMNLMVKLIALVHEEVQLKELYVALPRVNSEDCEKMSVEIKEMPTLNNSIFYLTA